MKQSHLTVKVSFMKKLLQWVITGSSDNIWSRPQHAWSSGSVLFFFMGVIQLLVAKTNKYYKQYLGTPDNDMLTTS
jgi:hypothetical protein